MKLAREFRRPDWRAMLAGMSSSELSEWGRFFHEQYFESNLLDTHFSKLSHLIISMIGGDSDITPRHFSLLNPPEIEPEMDSETMMSLAESLPGGVRYDPVSG